MKIKIYARTPDFSGTWNIEGEIEVPKGYPPEEINIEVKKYLKYNWQDKGWVIADYAWEGQKRKDDG